MPDDRKAPDSSAPYQSLRPGARYLRLKELAAVFLKLGTIGFGGPAAHIAMMDGEVVQRHKWLDRQTFLDLLAAANLIPGPSSTELAVYTHYQSIPQVGWLLYGIKPIILAIVIQALWGMGKAAVKIPSQTQCNCV